MSMPMQVVVAGTHSKLAAIATSVLGGDNSERICPWISAVHVEPPSHESSFTIAVGERRFDIEIGFYRFCREGYQSRNFQESR